LELSGSGSITFSCSAVPGLVFVPSYGPVIKKVS
jgi:hypothetical protein